MSKASIPLKIQLPGGGFINFSQPYLRQLFCNVTTHKYSLQVDPEVLYCHPVLNDLRGVGQVLYPGLDLLLEWTIESMKWELHLPVVNQIIPRSVIMRLDDVLRSKIMRKWQVFRTCC